MVDTALPVGRACARQHPHHMPPPPCYARPSLPPTDPYPTPAHLWVTGTSVLLVTKLGKKRYAEMYPTPARQRARQVPATGTDTTAVVPVEDAA